MLLAFNFPHFLMGTLLFVTSVFLILLVLVQRGRGGGLTGALGGMGGQSAFGTKAGDLFTRVTVVVAIIWITLNLLAIAWLNPPTQTPRPEGISPGTMAPEEPVGRPMEPGAPPDQPPGDPALGDPRIGDPAETAPGVGGEEVVDPPAGVPPADPPAGTDPATTDPGGQDGAESDGGTQSPD